MIATVAPAAQYSVLKEPVINLKAAGIIGVLLVSLYVTPALISPVMLGLAIYAWRGPKESIQALTLLFLLLNLNPALFPFYGRGISLRWLVLLSALGRQMYDWVLAGKRWPFHIMSLLTLYAVVVGCLGFLASRLPSISIFKAVAFLIGAAAIVTCFYRTQKLQDYWFSWFVTLFVFVLVASVPSYFSPAGFFTNGKGFQGILIHPQTFGPVMAPLTAALTVRLLLRQSRSLLVLGSVAGGLLAMYASQSRTAFLMYIGSVALAAIVMFVRGEKIRRLHRASVLWPGALLLVTVGLCIGLVVKGDVVMDASQRFFLKQSDTAESLSFQVRTSMVRQQMQNFYEQPFTGIGFGIPSTSNDWVSLSTGFLGLPTGFPVEKGFLPSAMLEETGLIGVSVLLVLLASLLGGVLKKSSLPIVAMMLACLLANVGEMVFFSFGGSGLYYWLLIAACYNSSIPCVE